MTWCGSLCAPSVPTTCEAASIWWCADRFSQTREAEALRSTHPRLAHAEDALTRADSRDLANLHQSTLDERVYHRQHVAAAAIGIDVIHLDKRSDDVRNGDGCLNHPPDLHADTIETVISPVAQTEHDDLGTNLAGQHVRRNRDSRGVRYRRTRHDHARDRKSTRLNSSHS